MSSGLVAGVVPALALALTTLLTPAVRGAAVAGGLVRPASSERWHTRPTPALGGVAIFAGFALAVGTGLLLDPGTVRALAELRSPRAVLPWSAWEGLMVASTLAFLLGLLDDLRPLPPLAKLAGQLVAASALLLAGVGVWLTGAYAVDAALSLLWFVGVTNALNLLDNMDGLAAGVSAIAGACLALLFWLEGAPGLAVVALGFGAALVGFLAHNYPPARIFMGDSGSLFVGLFLAGLALAPAPGLSRSLAAALAAPVLILGVPILDTTLVTVGRLIEGRPVSQGGRDHTSHRLVALGVPERRTVWLLWGLAAGGGAAGILLRSAARGTALLLGGVLVATLTLVGAYLLVARFRSLEEREEGGLPLYRFLVEGQARYPVLALLLDGVWLALAYYAAYLLRWDAGELAAELPYFQRTAALWVGAKLVALAAAGVYGSRWPTFGLYDALRVVRANVLATLLALGLVLLVDRVGLSRGVVALDLLTATALTLGARLSFRLMEGSARRWSEDGRRVVLFGPVDELEGAARHVERRSGDALHVAALAAPDASRRLGHLGPFRLYGGDDALGRALDATGAHAVVVAGPPAARAAARDALAERLERRGALDVFELEVVVRAVEWGGVERS